MRWSCGSVKRAPGCSCLVLPLERGWSPRAWPSHTPGWRSYLSSLLTSSWEVTGLSCSLLIGCVLPGHLFLPFSGCLQSLGLCTQCNWSYFSTKQFLLMPIFFPLSTSYGIYLFCITGWMCLITCDTKLERLVSEGALPQDYPRGNAHFLWPWEDVAVQPPAFGLAL